MAKPEHVEAVRAFNRFYTSRIGLTRGGYTRPLAEARVLYELGAGTEEVAELRTALGMDGGQLSRVLTRLEDQGLLSRHPSPLDARRQHVRLTEPGQNTFAALDAASASEIASILDGLDATVVVDAMHALRNAIEPHGTLTLRGPVPGDLGWVVQRHGELYAREYGWDIRFEQLVAQIVADFDPETDRAWIATLDGRRVGAVLCVHQDQTTAKLRTLLVEPETRGRGVGGRLVEEVIRHARDSGYATLTLWTKDVLHAARRLYERVGFTLVDQDLNEQTWSLNLKP